VYPDRWAPAALAVEAGLRRQDAVGLHEAARRGAAAVKGLLRAVTPADDEPEPPPAYLALVAQDLDDMGRFLRGEAVGGRPALTVQAAVHSAVSEQLLDLGRRQERALRTAELLGVPIYAGGDDLLTLVPARTALAAARTCHDLAAETNLRTASTAVLFFHRGSSLRKAVRETRELLEAAKKADSDKHALAVGFLRRSGVREQSIQPWHPLSIGQIDWDGQVASDLFGVFTAQTADARRLSARLVTVLERDAEELAEVARADRTLYELEIARLVGRHGGSKEEAASLVLLGERERSRPDHARGRARAARTRTPVPAAAARVAVFLRQECTDRSAPQDDGARSVAVTESDAGSGLHGA
jgi:CRISPR-associated protein Cmr2